MSEIARSSAASDRQTLARVAKYWAAPPPAAELQARIQEMYRPASERLARRKIAIVSEQQEAE